jgi:hypothetical protein
MVSTTIFESRRHLQICEYHHDLRVFVKNKKIKHAILLFYITLLCTAGNKKFPILISVYHLGQQISTYLQKYLLQLSVCNCQSVILTLGNKKYVAIPT